MSLITKIGGTKAEQIAVAMHNNGFSFDEVENTTGIARTRINKLRAPLVEVNRALITGMLVEAYEIADTANEVVNVARELGKLHGLYEPEKSIRVNVASGDIAKQLQQMSTEDLQKLLGTSPEGIVLEGEFDAA